MYRDQEPITCYYHGGPRDGITEVLPRGEAGRVRCFPTHPVVTYVKDTEPTCPIVHAAVNLTYYRRTGPIVDFIAHYTHDTSDTSDD
jgi:hypothetical protein